MKTPPTTPYKPQKNLIIWRPIVGFPRYRVSNRGEVLDLHNNRKLTQSTMPNGYKSVNLKKDGKQHKKYVHRLVAEAFHPNPDNLDTVDHINSNKINNCASNLQWMSNEDNALKSHEERGHIVNRWFSGFYDGELIGRWLFQMDAARELSLKSARINECLHGRCKQTGGFTFRYDD